MRGIWFMCFQMSLKQWQKAQRGENNSMKVLRSLPQMTVPENTDGADGVTAA